MGGEKKKKGASPFNYLQVKAMRKKEKKDVQRVQETHALAWKKGRKKKGKGCTSTLISPLQS